MHSFTIPVFMNTFSVLLLLSLVGNAFSAAIDIRSDYYAEHHGHQTNNNVQPRTRGYPSMPSVSSRIFIYWKQLKANEMYLKDDPWRSSLGISANANSQLDDTTRPHAVGYHNHPYGYERPHDGYQQRPTHSTAQEPEVAGGPVGSSALASPNRGCQLKSPIPNAGSSPRRLSVLFSAMRNLSLSDIQTSLRRLITVHSSLAGAETGQDQTAFGEEDFSVIIADYLWT